MCSSDLYLVCLQTTVTPPITSTPSSKPDQTLKLLGYYRQWIVPGVESDENQSAYLRTPNSESQGGYKCHDALEQFHLDSFVFTTVM